MDVFLSPIHLMIAEQLRTALEKGLPLIRGVIETEYPMEENGGEFYLAVGIIDFKVEKHPFLPLAGTTGINIGLSGREYGSALYARRHAQKIMVMSKIIRVTNGKIVSID